MNYYHAIKNIEVLHVHRYMSYYIELLQPIKKWRCHKCIIKGNNLRLKMSYTRTDADKLTDKSWSTIQRSEFVSKDIIYKMEESSLLRLTFPLIDRRESIVANALPSCSSKWTLEFTDSVVVFTALSTLWEWQGKWSTSGSSRYRSSCVPTVTGGSVTYFHPWFSVSNIRRLPNCCNSMG